MSYQQLFDFTGPQLRDAGIRLAAESAEQLNPGWNERAYDLLIKFLKENKRFMAEDVRSYAEKQNFEMPPSARAWGGIINKAARQYIIIKTGIKPVKNPKAHCANAAMWERNDERMIDMKLI
ncbi:MAG: hypothetical protein QM791_04270 [Ferruginibacter sp.]